MMMMMMMMMMMTMTMTMMMMMMIMMMMMMMMILFKKSWLFTFYLFSMGVDLDKVVLAAVVAGARTAESLLSKSPHGD